MIKCPGCGHQFEPSRSAAPKCPNCERFVTPDAGGSQTLNLNASDEPVQSKPVGTISSTDELKPVSPSASEDARKDTTRDGSETFHQPATARELPNPADPMPGNPQFKNAAEIRELVQSIAGPSARPGMTIKQTGRHQVQVDALVLQRRSMASQRDANADESDYQVIGTVGEGGMGTVYSALQTSVRRNVAVKTLKPKLANDLYDRKKFLKEACITAGLDHPNIVPVYDLGISDDGTLFYSMKLIRGKSWVDVLAEKTRAENLDILIRVCDALSLAHSRRIIHRDIKPENVMLGAFGEVLVTDWGLAVDLNQGTTFSFGGSPAYMAPEMAGHDAGKIGIASDIYLLGATLFELVTGYPPHPGQTATECVLAASENLIFQYEKSDNLLDVALKAMATDGKDRFPTVAAFQTAIRQYQSQMESIAFTENGFEALKHAIANSDFESFSRSLFSFQDAIKVWPENAKAIHGEREARLKYAIAALEQKNFDLGLSVLDPETDAEQKVHRDLAKGQRESKKWRSYLKIARTTALVLGFIAIAGTSYGFLMASLANSKLDRARQNAEIARDDAEAARDEAELARDEESKQKKLALDAQGEAERARDEESKQKKLALDAQGEAERARDEESKQKKLALDAQGEAERARDEANTQRSRAESLLSSAVVGQYVANISYADSEIKRNRIPGAYEQLERVRENELLKQNQRGWELHRLYQLCHESKEDLLTLPIGLTIEFFSASSDGRIEVVVLSDGSVYTRQSGPGNLTIQFNRIENLRLATKTSDAFRQISSLAVSVEGDLAVGYTPSPTNARSSDDQHYLEIRNLKNGTLKASVSGHNEGIRFVEFAGDRLVTVGDESLANNRTRRYRYIRLWNFDQRSTITGEHSALFTNPVSKTDVWTICRPTNQLLYARQNRPGEFQVQMLSLDGSNWPADKRMAPAALHQVVENQREPETLDSDIKCMAMVPASSTGEGAFICICGMQDGSIMLISQSGEILNRQLASNAHSASVTDLQWLEDKLVSAGADKNVLVWNWDPHKWTLTQAFELAGHRHDIVGLSLNPDSLNYTTVDHRLVRQWGTGGPKDEIQLWSDDRLANQEGARETPETAAFASMQDDAFASLIGNSRGTVQYSLSSGAHFSAVFPEHLAPRKNIVCEYDSEKGVLIAASGQGKLSLWSVTDGTRITSLDIAGKMPVMDFNASTRRVLTYGSSGKFIAVRDVDSNRVLGEFETRGYGGEATGGQSVTDSRLSHDGRFVAISGGIRKFQPIINIVNVDTKKTVGHFESGRKAVSSMIFDAADEKLIVAFQPDKPNSQSDFVINVQGMEWSDNDERLSTDSSANAVVAPSHFDRGRPFDLGFVGYHNNRLVSVARQDEKASVLVWDAPAWQKDTRPARIIDLQGIHANTRFELSNAILTFVDPEGHPVQLDITGSINEKKFDGVSEAIISDLQRSDTLKKVVRQCTLMPAGQLLVTGMNYVWVLQPNGDGAWQVVFRIVPEPPCDQTGLSDDGRSGITRHVDGRVRLFKFGEAGDANPQPVVVNIDGIYDLASLSPDGSTIAVFDNVSGLRLLDFQRSFREQKAVLAPSPMNSIGFLPLTALTWSPDNELIAGASANGEIHLWDANSAEPKAKPETGLGQSRIDKISISRPGSGNQRVVSTIDSESQLRILATSADEGELAVWTMCPRLADLPAMAETAAINPNYAENGFRIAVGLSNSQVQIWLVEISENGFAERSATAENQIYRVFDFSPDDRDSDVIFLGFDHTGRELATLTEQKMLVWLTGGWEKAKPVDGGANSAEPANTNSP